MRTGTLSIDSQHDLSVWTGSPASGGTAQALGMTEDDVRKAKEREEKKPPFGFTVPTKQKRKRSKT